MKSFKCFVFLSAIFFAIIFSNINLSHADSLNATLGGDGVVRLSGSCSVQCIPSGYQHPVFAIVYLYMTPGGFSGTLSVLSTQEQPKLTLIIARSI